MFKPNFTSQPHFDMTVEKYEFLQRTPNLELLCNKKNFTKIVLKKSGILKFKQKIS